LLAQEAAPIYNLNVFRPAKAQGSAILVLAKTAYAFDTEGRPHLAHIVNPA
jgi:hypothetical protein